MNARIPKFTLPFVVLASIASMGCIPTVVWLPDSSGIIYTTTDWPGLDGGSFIPKELQGRLIQYDLKKKSARIIAKAETNTIQPALSPNGKQIAVARINLEKDKQPSLLVVVYDLAGKEIQRSKPLDWGGVPKYDTDVGIQKFSQLFWAPHENKVLVYANKHSGIYDLGKDQIVVLGEAVPSIFGTTPVRPDGKGFLLAKADDAISFVDWEGKQSEIAVPAEKLSVREKGILQYPAIASWSSWDGQVAIATWRERQLRIDTGKKTAELQKVDEAVWALDGKEIQQIYTFPNGKTKLAVIYLQHPRYFKKAGVPELRVDLIGPEAGRQRTLIETTAYCGVYPSPNNELVALRCCTGNPDKKEEGGALDQIMVVNQKGDVVAEINASK
jgi:hypothetical protein